MEIFSWGGGSRGYLDGGIFAGKIGGDLWGIFWWKKIEGAFRNIKGLFLWVKGDFGGD